MYTIAVIVGSLRKESINLELAKALEHLGKDRFRFVYADISGLPLFSQDIEDNLPAPVAAMKKTVADADAVLFVTPEYNRSIPGVLKNALDWGSRPYGQNVWAGKPAAMAGASPGAVGTAVAQSHLRSVLGFLGMVLTVQPEVYLKYSSSLIGDDGSVKDDGTATFLRGFLDAFAAWIAALKGK